jgi:hypothetical protein
VIRVFIINLIGCWSGHGGARRTIRQFRAGIVRPHEGFAHQKGMNAVLAHERHIRRGVNAAFSDDGAVRRDAGQQIQGGVQPGFKGAQVAVVDADQRYIKRQRPIQFLGVMHFHQHPHAEFSRQLAPVRRNGASSSAATISRMQSAPISPRFVYLVRGR